MSGSVIRVKPLDSAWETLGIDRFRGIVAEDIEAASDDWGPSSLRFALKARPGAQRPDLTPFTPVEYERDGILVWSGRMWERPSVRNAFTIGCQGWQHHLDDEALSRVYVHTRMSDYRDQRSFLSANLAVFRAAPQVTTDSGIVTLMYPNGSVSDADYRAGVTLDLGSDSTAKRIVVEWTSSNNAGNCTLYAYGSNTEDAALAGGDTAFTVVNNSAASGTTPGTFATARRYVHLFMIETFAGTLTVDIWFKLKSIKVFRLTDYESGNASVLEADEVIRDVLPLAPLLNQSTTQIADGTFAIPEWVANDISPRQAIEAVNAFENSRTKIAGDDLRTLLVDAKPSAPLFEVGSWSGHEFADATVSGEDIYDQVIVVGTGPDGSPLRVTRTQTGTFVDRRSFHRTKVLPINSAFTQLVGERVGDLWLSEHRTAPFAGTLTVAGEGIRKHLSGEPVPAAVLLRHTGEKIRFTDQIDPDTGAVGRDGRIAGVTYRAKDDSLTIAIDDRRDQLERVLQRYGALTGQLG